MIAPDDGVICQRKTAELRIDRFGDFERVSSGERGAWGGRGHGFFHFRSTLCARDQGGVAAQFFLEAVMVELGQGV